MSFFVENEMKIIQKKPKRTEVAHNDAHADDKQGFFRAPNGRIFSYLNFKPCI